jgi:DNA-binding CsgD family transcriptional regulator
VVGDHGNEADKVARLTDKQRQCLELVVLRKSSKEIARELGISKPTVDQRITNARIILGAADRDQAALIFARHTQTYDRVIYDTARVPLMGFQTDSGSQEATFESGLILQEAAIPYSGITEHQLRSKPVFLRSPFDDFNTTQRLLIIVGLTVGILAIVLVGLSVAQSISGLLTAS